MSDDISDEEFHETPEIDETLVQTSYVPNNATQKTAKAGSAKKKTRAESPPPDLEALRSQAKAAKSNAERLKAETVKAFEQKETVETQERKRITRERRKREKEASSPKLNEKGAPGGFDSKVKIGTSNDPGPEVDFGDAPPPEGDSDDIVVVIDQYFNITARQFYEFFLADKAVFSIGDFHALRGDVEIVVSHWKDYVRDPSAPVDERFETPGTKERRFSARMKVDSDFTRLHRISRLIPLEDGFQMVTRALTPEIIFGRQFSVTDIWFVRDVPGARQCHLQILLGGYYFNYGFAVTLAMPIISSRIKAEGKVMWENWTEVAKLRLSRLAHELTQEGGESTEDEEEEDDSTHSKPSAVQVEPSKNRVSDSKQQKDMAVTQTSSLEEAKADEKKPLKNATGEAQGTQQASSKTSKKNGKATKQKASQNSTESESVANEETSKSANPSSDSPAPDSTSIQAKAPKEPARVEPITTCVEQKASDVVVKTPSQASTTSSPDVSSAITVCDVSQDDLAVAARAVAEAAEAAERLTTQGKLIDEKKRLEEQRRKRALQEIEEAEATAQRARSEAKAAEERAARARASIGEAGTISHEESELATTGTTKKVSSNETDKNQSKSDDKGHTIQRGKVDEAEANEANENTGDEDDEEDEDDEFEDEDDDEDEDEDEDDSENESEVEDTDEETVASMTPKERELHRRRVIVRKRELKLRERRRKERFIRRARAQGLSLSQIKKMLAEGGVIPALPKKGSNSVILEEKDKMHLSQKEIKNREAAVSETLEQQNVRMCQPSRQCSPEGNCTIA